MNTDTIGCLGAILVLIIAIGLTFAWVGIAYWLWGVVMVGVFGLPALTYWQCFALYWLIHLLFPSGSAMKYKYNKEAF